MSARNRTARRSRWTAALQLYIEASRSEATRAAYASDIGEFRKWGGRIPTTPRIVARYLAEHAGKLAYSTLTRRLAAINHAHRQRDVASPTATEVVRATLRGIRRTHRRQQRQAAPLLREDLRKRVRAAPGLRGVRDRALLLLGFAGGFRASEIVGLNAEDVEFVREGLFVHLRKSKTDQEGKGRLVPVPYGRGPSWTCPVRMARAWIRKAGIESGALFRKVDRNGLACGERLSPQVVSLVVKELARRLGKDPAIYSGHSLRAGFVTSAAAAGVPTWKIRQQTGHKSDQILLRYIRPTDAFSNHALLRLL